MFVAAEQYSTGARGWGYLQRFIEAFSRTLIVGFDCYDICVTVDFTYSHHRFVDEMWPLRPLSFPAGALDTNEETPISL